MPIDFSVSQMIIVLVIALLAFGPRRLPDVGRGIGQELRELRGSLRDERTDRDRPGVAPA